jgi:hypothetical protein
MTMWRAAMLGWVVMALAATVNGIVRVVVLEPWLGERVAGVISVISAIVILQVIAFFSLRRHPAASRTQLAAIAAAWLLMTIAFEFIFGRYVEGMTWRELAANYNLLQGRLWPIVLVSIFCAPFWWGRVSPNRRAVYAM